MQPQGFSVPCAMKIKSNLLSLYCTNRHPFWALIGLITLSVYPSHMHDTPVSLMHNCCAYFYVGKMLNLRYALHKNQTHHKCTTYTLNT